MSELDLASLRSAAETVYRTLAPTPQLEWPLLSGRCGFELWVKHENHQATGAFKVRGGLVYFDKLRDSDPGCRRVVAATRGNHGQSVAFAARNHGMRASIVVPQGNNPDKNRAMRGYGAELIEFGQDFNESLDHAAQLAGERGLHLVPSFHCELVRGVASYALEFFRGAPPLDVAFVPVGLGSGICGMIAARDALGLKTEIVGVVAERAPAYALSFAAGRPVEGPGVPATIADGVACRIPDPQALDFILEGATEIVEVSETAIADAMRHLFDDAHQVAEGAGAIALAAALKQGSRLAGKRVGVVLSGGNVERATYRTILSPPAC